MEERKIVFLDNTQLEIGMELAEALYNQQGLFVLKKGTVLNEKIISGLVLMDIKDIPIWQKVIKEPGDKLEFFQELYEKTDCLINSFWDDVKKSRKIDKSKALSITDEIFKNFLDHEEIIKYMEKTKQYNHSLNVALIAYMFTKWLNLSEDMEKELIFTALVHDIGKLFLPLERQNEHTVLGARFMAQQGASRAIQQGIQMHHAHEEDAVVSAEWWSIHPFAKIIAIADFYDHVTNPESELQSKVQPFRFIVTLGNNYYGKFDIRYMELFLSKIAKSYMGHEALLSDGRKGKIVFINPNALARPIVQTEEGLVDLYLENNLEIADVY